MGEIRGARVHTSSEIVENETPESAVNSFLRPEFLMDETLPKMLLTTTKVPNVHFTDPRNGKFFCFFLKKGFSFNHKLKQKVALINTETNHATPTKANSTNHAKLFC